VLPTTTVQFPATSSKCTSLNGAELEVVRHVVQLGVDCGDAIDDPFPEDGTFFFDDLYVECHEGGNFANLDSTGDLGTRYSCGQNQIFLDGDAATPKTVLAFSMTTDSEWLNDAASSCYKFGPTTVDTTPTASATTPSAPQATAIAPVTVNGPTAGDGNDTSKEQEAPLGLIAGVSVGAVLFLAIAGVVLVVLLCRKSPTAREAQQQQKKDLTRVQDATSSERDINDASHQMARYHSGQGGGGRDDDLYQGQYVGHAPAFTDPPAPYATVQVLPAEAIIDIPASARTDRGGALSKSSGQLTNEHDVPYGGGGGSNNRRASNGVVVGGGDGRYQYSASSMGQQQDVAATFKDQAQSMVVDGHPMAGNSIFAPRMMMAEERNNATFSSSGLSDDANTRGSSDPSGVISPPSANGRRAAAASVGRYYDV
jgi:hypothetical protein